MHFLWRTSLEESHWFCKSGHECFQTKSESVKVYGFDVVNFVGDVIAVYGALSCICWTLDFNAEERSVVTLNISILAFSARGCRIHEVNVKLIENLQNSTYSNVDVRGMITGFQFLQFLTRHIALTMFYDKEITKCLVDFLRHHKYKGKVVRLTNEKCRLLLLVKLYDYYKLRTPILNPRLKRLAWKECRETLLNAGKKPSNPIGFASLDMIASRPPKLPKSTSFKQFIIVLTVYFPLDVSDDNLMLSVVARILVEYIRNSIVLLL
ncbi:hypothetical protein H5410_064390 [Solanum commersonii]|uniref:Uncharacterized protein n=1 Tax=Solanum commersonii TaxID=4109 RepID=A0A9J5VZJ4_SOLCO|nr:hypothetical protein H5410_064390 [Solanum commersonii]